MPAKLKIIKTVELIGDILSLARVPSTEQVYAGSYDGKIYDIDVAQENPEPVSMTGHISYVSGLAVAGKYVVSGGSDHQLIWWDRHTHAKIRAIEAHQKWIRAVNGTSGWEDARHGWRRHGLPVVERRKR